MATTTNHSAITAAAEITLDPCDMTPWMSTATEETALLPKKSPRKRTPLPKLQIGILWLMQLADPICSTSIFPFINQLITELDITGGDPRKVGYYSGLIESIYFATEALTVLQWSRLSDRVGRKPILLMGLLGGALSITTFGLSTTFWGLVMSRSLTGALNGNVGVAKAATAELCDPTNIAAGFALMPIAWAAGTTIGPFLGGQLSRPADRWPGVFTHPFWRLYPYFLPCFVAALFAITCFLTTLTFFKETLHREPSLEPTESGTSTPATTSSQAPLPLRELLIPQVLIPVANYGAIAFLDIARIAVQPLIYSTPVEAGGLGMNPASIGFFMGTEGLLNGIVQILTFTALVERFGAKGLFTIGVCALIPSFALYPCMNMLAMQYGGASWQVRSTIVVQMFFTIAMEMAFGCIAIFVNNAAPNKQSLGATNGISQTAVSVLRALAPALATSSFALSREKNLLHGNAAYVAFGALTIGALFLTRGLEERRDSDEDKAIGST